LFDARGGDEAIVLDAYSGAEDNGIEAASGHAIEEAFLPVTAIGQLQHDNNLLRGRCIASGLRLG
jgi:hypothetical protein